VLSPWAQDAKDHWKRHRPKMCAETLDSLGEKRASNARNEFPLSVERNGSPPSLEQRETESPVPTGRGRSTAPGRKSKQFTGSIQSGNDHRITEATQHAKPIARRTAAHRSASG
jgi:hypothetical protein